MSTPIVPTPTSTISRLAKGASVSFIGKVGGRIFRALSQVVLARTLGPTIFGLYVLGWTLFRVVSAIAPLGLDKGVIRFAMPYWNQDNVRLKSVLLQSLSMGALAGFSAGFIIFLVAPWLGEMVFQEPALTLVFRLFALALPVATILKIASAATRVSQRMKFSIYAEDVVQPIANLGLIITIYWLGGRLLGAVSAVVISFALATGLALFYVRRLYAEVLIESLSISQSAKTLLAFSLPTTFVGLLTMLNSWTDRLMLGYFRPATEVGVYQGASQFVVFFAITLNALNAIFIPMIVDLYHKQELNQLEELFRISTKWGLYLCLPPFLVILFDAEAIITLMFGSQYAVGATASVILSLAQLANVGTGAVGYLMVMTDRQNLWLLISGFTLLINISLNLWLIPQFGLIGAAIATASSICSLFGIGLLTVKRVLNLWPYDWRYFKGIVAALLASLSLLGAGFLSLDNLIVDLLVSVVISVGIFVGTLWLLGLEAEDRAFIELVQKQIEK